MYQQSEVRLLVATALAQTYVGLKDVEAILVGGSVARGWADQWSDVEVVVYWSSLPTPDFLATLAATSGVTGRKVFISSDDDGSVDEESMLDGLKIDLSHRSTSVVQAVITQVVTCTNPNWMNQAQVNMLETGIVLHGLAWVEDWRKRSAYPSALANAMVREHLQFGPHAWLEMLAEREDVIYLNSLFCEVERRIVGTLLGVNHRYAPTADLKWMVQVARTLPIAPEHLAVRLLQVFREDSLNGVRALRVLIEESIAIVEQQLPEIETASVRERLAQTRPVWHGRATSESD